jgi:hypothetical protein
MVTDTVYLLATIIKTKINPATIPGFCKNGSLMMRLQLRSATRAQRHVRFSRNTYIWMVEKLCNQYLRQYSNSFYAGSGQFEVMHEKTHKDTDNFVTAYMNR